MGIDYEAQWLSNGADHVRTQATATGLIESAARALKDTQDMEILNWALAAQSARAPHQGTFLRVYKDAHQVEGAFGQFVHLTMALRVQKRTGDFPHSLYGGCSFHLYVEIIDPVVGSSTYQLRPHSLSYKDKGMQFHRFAINNADMVNSDKR